ncbi:MAG: hypothetical protein IJ168_05445 [Eubacterium sp.]|nr:hypothetical protein [Eubacterium sp.]
MTGTDDNGATVSLDQDIYHSAYGFFYDRQVVCAGFTLAYSYLMNMVGVECTYVGSSTMGHAWNKAKIDGHWYNIDLTFDNFDYDGSGYNTYGSMKHRHFLKSDAYFGTEAGSFHYNGTTYDDCTADDTAFDEAFWDDVQSRIYTVNGDYYYLDPYYNGRYSTVTLTRRSADGTEEALCDSFSATRLGFYASSTEITDSGRTIHKTLFDEVLAKLSYLDNRFYLCAGNAIYSVTLDGRRFYICPLDANACGLGVNGEHNLFYQLYTGTKTENSHIDALDKVEYFRQHISTDESDSDYNNYPDINLDGYVNAKDYTYIIQA